MKKKIFTFGLIFTLTGCGINDAINITTAVISKNPTAAFKSIAQSKALGYAINPKRLSNDLDFISSLLDDITSVWGEGNEKLPKEKEYVKYMQNYKSRALIDFDKGIVTVETIDKENTRRSLTNAIITALLLPDDPQSVDLFGTNEVKLGATPYLLGEIKDDKNEDIRYEWRANRFAEILIDKQLKQKNIKKDGKNLTVYYVNISMVKDHASIRVAKFQPLVKKYAEKFNVSKNLINAIIKTESNFNQFAISSAGALGLMQIVPTSAGRDAYKHTKGSTWTPSREYLFDAKNNIELGSAYIQLLNSKYLNGIYNQISKEYCVISAYNTGSGNVLKTFSTNNKKAKDLINRKTPSEVYNTLRNELPYKETRRYLQKVINYKKEFVNL